jgi:hypothetical protein
MESAKKRYDPFAEFFPIKWDAPDSDSKDGFRSIYSVKRNHGVIGEFLLHNTNDEINKDRTLLERVVIEYKIGKQSYTIFTVGDFFEVDYAFDEKASGNIMGDLAERISRRE